MRLWVIFKHCALTYDYYWFLVSVSATSWEKLTCESLVSWNAKTGQEVGNSKKDFIRQVLVDDSARRACFYALIFKLFSRLIYVDFFWSCYDDFYRKWNHEKIKTFFPRKYHMILQIPRKKSVSNSLHHQHFSYVYKEKIIDNHYINTENLFTNFFLCNYYSLASCNRSPLFI